MQKYTNNTLMSNINNTFYENKTILFFETKDKINNNNILEIQYLITCLLAD